MHLDSYFAGLAERDWDTGADGTVDLAVVGVGAFAREFVLPSMAETDYCEVNAFVTGSPDAAADLADEHGVDRTLDYETFHAGDAADAYDAVYVGGPNALHLDYARSAAEQGKAVLVEKPMEATLDRARQLRRVCEDAGVTLMVAYRPQVDPALRALRSFVRDGGLGDPVQFQGGFTGHIVGDDGDEDQWRLDADLAGGGALLDVGVYPLNAARFLLDADPATVSATARSTGPPFDEVDEHVAFRMEFPDGVTASCTASYRAQADDWLRLVGTEGQALVNPAYNAGVTPTVTIERGDRRAEFEGPFVDEVAEEFDHFAHAVLTGATPDPDGRGGVVDMATVEAVYESDETGRRVDVERIE